MTDKMKSEVYDIKQLADIFRCSVSKAYEIKKCIKAVSDITHNTRMVHQIDIENYFAVNRRNPYDDHQREKERQDFLCRE